MLDDNNFNNDKKLSLIEDLKKGISGLSCLKFTYKDDEVLCSQFDLLIDKIKEVIKLRSNKFLKYEKIE